MAACTLSGTEYPASGMDDLSILGGLFAIAFVAATILPAQSEAALVGLLVAGTHSPVLLVAVASVGNVLGSVVNWGLGRGVERFRERPWFPVKPSMLDRATGWYRRWGRWSLLLSRAPIGGDALTVAAGVLREPFWSFVLLVAIAKAARYILLAAFTLSWSEWLLAVLFEPGFQKRDLGFLGGDDLVRQLDQFGILIVAFQIGLRHVDGALMVGNHHRREIDAGLAAHLHRAHFVAHCLHRIHVCLGGTLHFAHRH